MSPHRFDKSLGGFLEIDFCFACQGIWFDDYESSQLTPGSVIALFKLIQQVFGERGLDLQIRQALFRVVRRRHAAYGAGGCSMAATSRG